jgi:(1->4)-alpha-D-glucan 1-alpha-D-glucosylmutase
MHLPRATYRLQFTPAFGFRHAEAIVPYLSALGVSDVYAGPIFAAVPGSLHGYDVTDPNRLNPELGTRQDFESLMATVQAHRMSWLQDIVPNHMAFHRENRMLMDVLEKGVQSEYAEFFDIRRGSGSGDKPPPVVIGVLGEPLEQAVAERKLQIVYEKGRLYAEYFDHKYPLAWDSYPQVLAFEKTTPYELKDLLGTICMPEETAAAKEEAIEALRKLVHNDLEARAFLDRRLDLINNANGTGTETLSEVLSRQNFRLAFWKDVNAQGNYRRFFHLPEFIALNAGRRDVFERTHRLVFRTGGKRVLSGASHRSYRRPLSAAALFETVAPAVRQPLYRGGEDSRYAGGPAAGMARAGHDGLRVSQLPQRAVLRSECQTAANGVLPHVYGRPGRTGPTCWPTASG